MDESDLFKSSGLSVGIIGIIYVVIRIIKTMNNKRIHSKCNGKDVIDLVIDVHEATVEEKKPTPKPSPVIKPKEPETQPPESVLKLPPCELGGASSELNYIV